MAAPTLTRSTFELIARVLRESDSISADDRGRLAEDFARALAATNERFDAERFIDAVVSR